MTKVVYNTCFGGFGLSDDAVRRYADIKGLALYIEPSAYGFSTYWTVAPELRVEPLEGTAGHQASLEERIAHNKAHSEQTISPREIPRTDPALVQVVEELGVAANGRHAALAIADIPPGTKYRIDEYDGRESVMTIDDYEWLTA